MKKKLGVYVGKVDDSSPVTKLNWPRMPKHSFTATQPSQPVPGTRKENADSTHHSMSRELGIRAQDAIRRRVVSRRIHGIGARLVERSL